MVYVYRYTPVATPLERHFAHLLLDVQRSQRFVDVVLQRCFDAEAVLFQRVDATLQRVQPLLVHCRRTHNHCHHHTTNDQPNDPVEHGGEGSPGPSWLGLVRRMNPLQEHILLLRLLAAAVFGRCLRRSHRSGGFLLPVVDITSRPRPVTPWKPFSHYPAAVFVQSFGALSGKKNSGLETRRIGRISVASATTAAAVSAVTSRVGLIRQNRRGLRLIRRRG